MVEQRQALKRFDYKELASLVVRTEHAPRDLGPSSELASLTEKKSTRQLLEEFGSRARVQKPAGEQAAAAAARRKKRDAREEAEGGGGSSSSSSSSASRGPKQRKVETVLSADVRDVYRPQSKDTARAYEVLLSFLQQELPDVSHDVLRDAADEVLAVLKDESLKQGERQRRVEELLQSAEPMSADRFHQLYNIGQKITDFLPAGGGAENGDSATGATARQEEVNVRLPEEEGADGEREAEEDELEELDPHAAVAADVVADEVGDEEEGEEAAMDERIETKEALKAESQQVEEAARGKIDPATVDAFWLQRQVAPFYKEDPVQAQRIAESALTTLQDAAKDDRVAENELVASLGYDKFELIKRLLRNRWTVAFCTRLARAKDAAARSAVEEEMAVEPHTRAILAEMRRSVGGAQQRGLDLERQLMSEARALQRGAGEDAGALGAAALAPTDADDADAFLLRSQRTLLDLEALAFEKGSHTQTNTKFKLPKGSQIIERKGFQEVYIPAPKPAPLQSDEREVLISELPEWMQPAFPKMKSLNRIQSRIHHVALSTAENMLICAPTGAGKTNCAMLAIMRELGLHRGADGQLNLDAFKIVYIAPMKSLVQEMVANFGPRLKPFGISVKELSGDQQLSKAQIDNTQVIVTTPEKWDIITRKSGERTYTELVRLIIMDEVHLLHDSRGPVLESIVARTIRQVEATQQMIRLVALSATLPNYLDVASFLRVRPDKGLFVFDRTYRPIPLQQLYVGVTVKKAFKRMAMMNEICYEKVRDYAANKQQVLVFVHSRKDTATTARFLRDKAVAEEKQELFVGEDEGLHEMLRSVAERVSNKDLKELLPQGFAIHHAGMNRDDRRLVEDLFAGRHLQVLVSTATLAWGVNLPAHTVIIKGTQVYSPEHGDWVELSPLDVMQMLGRAGRPQFDDYGEGVVITSHSELHFYLSLLNEQLPVESQFIKRLADSLNAEAVLGSVTNLREAVVWLGYTYLTVRMRAAPGVYGLKDGDKATVQQRLIDLAHSAAVLLDKHNLLKYDRRTGAFQVTDLGRVASHFYITYSSMATYNEHLKPTMSDIDLFRVFTLSSEFKQMMVREEEKIELAKLLDKAPIPIKEHIEEPSLKCNVLLQAYISRLKFDGFALSADMVYITQSAARVLRALFEIALRRGWSSVAQRALELCKMVDHRMWSVESPLRQFPQIPRPLVRKIEGKDFPWDQLFELEPHVLGELVGDPSRGNLLHRCVHLVPRLDLQGHVQPVTRTLLRVELTITPDFEFDDKVHGAAEAFWIIVEDVDSETIIHFEYFILKQQYAKEEHLLTFTLPIREPVPPQYFVRVLSDRWLCPETVLPISFRQLLLPEKFAPPTELLDLRPVPLSDLGNERFARLFAPRFERFNPVQTQSFPALFSSSDNVLLLAPTGSGKTACAELAILHMLSGGGGKASPAAGARCVYVAPLESLVKARYEEWRARLPQTLGVRVARLTGEAAQDLQLLAENEVCLATPEHWDMLSRRWNTRKQVQKISLFIVDEVHLIGGQQGPVLEVILSRMRYISTQPGNAIRIVALGASIANGKDMGEWLGCKPSHTFLFHPNVRPLPIEVRVQGFENVSFHARILSMLKPAYSHIKRFGGDKPVLIFVPARKYTRSVAFDLLTMAAGDGNRTRFLHARPEDVEATLASGGVRNELLAEALRAGVGFFHDGLSEREQQTVVRLYEAGAVQVVVVEQSLCWSLPLTAHLVLILGCEYYDGREHRYVDVPMTDILQMMGRASRPWTDKESKCSLFCPASRKEFYKKFLHEPLPVESHLDTVLADHLNAEIIAKRVKNVQDAVDYLTWTLYYRRITQNPNYYHLQGVSHRHLSDHLSELVETTVKDLERAGCIAVEDGTRLFFLNLGMIATYYYIRYTTVELFNELLTPKVKLSALLSILSNASEFDHVPVRHKEDIALRKLAMHLPLKVEDAGNWNDPHAKVNVLLQTHLSRVPLAAAVAEDRQRVLPDALRLLQAMVDVLSSKSILRAALSCMELSQMVTMGLWSSDSQLLQLPHVTPEMVLALKAKGVSTVFGLLEMDDSERAKIVRLPDAKMREFILACNAFPNVELRHELRSPQQVRAGESVRVHVTLSRDEDESAGGESKVPTVVAPLFPGVKHEGWWLVVGDKNGNELLSIKRVAMKEPTLEMDLEFVAGGASGPRDLTLFLMSDSYLGVDQEFSLRIHVLPNNDMADESDSDADGRGDGDDEAK